MGEAKTLIRLRPLQDRVIVKRTEVGEKKFGDLYVPDVAKEKPQEGVVLAVGQGHIDPYTGAIVPVDVCVGDTVLFGKYSGVEVEVEALKDKVLILKEDELMAVYTE